MGKYSSYDGEIDGQMTIDDLYSPPERMVAVSNIFARARKNMTLAEQKTFVLALSRLNWTQAPDEQSNVVRIDNKTLQQVLGYTSDSSDISQHIWDAIKQLPPHSYIEIADRDKEFFTSGSVVATISKRKGTGYVRVKFEEDYFPLFVGLGERYITLWSMDIFRMRHKRSVQFYELLRQMSYARYEVSTNVYSYGWGIKALKDMFDIPKEGRGSYMTKDGHFARTHFERYVIDPLCEDLGHCRMIQLILQPDGRPYAKVKKGNKVQGYQFFWSLSQRPAVADAHEVKQLADRVEKNPQVLKIAKDIASGKPKPETKPSTSRGFDNFEGRGYDFDALERIIAQQG